MASAGMPHAGSTVDADGNVGKTSYITLPFGLRPGGVTNPVYRNCWGCSQGIDPMQIFAQSNADSYYWDQPLCTKIETTIKGSKEASCPASSACPPAASCSGSSVTSTGNVCPTGLISSKTNSDSLVCTYGVSSHVAASRSNAAALEKSEIVPSGGAQRWDYSWLQSLAATSFASAACPPGVPSGTNCSITNIEIPSLSPEYANINFPSINGEYTITIPSTPDDLNEYKKFFPLAPHPQKEYAAWANWYASHPQYWDIADNGGTMPTDWQNGMLKNAQLGFVPPQQPLDLVDCPPDLSSTGCNYGDLWAYRYALTSAMDGSYGVMLSDYSDSFPGMSTQSDFNPRIVRAFAKRYKLDIPGDDVSAKAKWILTNSLNQWNDYLSHSYGHFFRVLADRIGAATQHPPLVIDQCQGSPFWSRFTGQDMRIVAEEVNPRNYICVHDEHVMSAGRRGPIVFPVVQELAGLAINAAYEPALRNGANLEADDRDYWNMMKDVYDTRNSGDHKLSSAEQSEVGYKLLKRLWLYAAWAHIADRSGNTRRALAFTTRDYWDVGSLTAAQLGPLQTLIQTIVPTHPFGPAIYYSESAMKAAEARTQQFGPRNYGKSNAYERASLQNYIDNGGAVAYYVSDVALARIVKGTANAPSAWIVLQDLLGHDSYNDIPADEMSKLKSIAPVIDEDGNQGGPGAIAAAQEVGALPDEPLLFSTDGGPLPVSPECRRLGYGATISGDVRSTALTGFGFYDQNNVLTIVVSNPSPCPDASSISGWVKVKLPKLSGDFYTGPATVTDLFANVSSADHSDKDEIIDVKSGVANIPIMLSRWDTTVLTIKTH